MLARLFKEFEEAVRTDEKINQIAEWEPLVAEPLHEASQFLLDAYRQALMEETLLPHHFKNINQLQHELSVKVSNSLAHLKNKIG